MREIPRGFHLRHHRCTASVFHEPLKEASTERETVIDMLDYEYGALNSAAVRESDERSSYLLSRGWGGEAEDRARSAWREAEAALEDARGQQWAAYNESFCRFDQDEEGAPPASSRGRY